MPGAGRSSSVIAPEQSPNRVEEIQHGRNFIRKGDLVRVAPPVDAEPGTHGFKARFEYADEDQGGVFYCVIGQEKNEKGILVGTGFRFVKPERVERKATTHDPLNVRATQERKAAKKEARSRGKASA